MLADHLLQSLPEVGVKTLQGLNVRLEGLALTMHSAFEFVGPCRCLGLEITGLSFGRGDHFACVGLGFGESFVARPLSHEEGPPHHLLGLARLLSLALELTDARLRLTKLILESTECGCDVVEKPVNLVRFVSLFAVAKVTFSTSLADMSM